jgi:hypothetical protein
MTKSEDRPDRAPRTSDGGFARIGPKTEPTAADVC